MLGTRRYRRYMPHIQEDGGSFFVTFSTRNDIVLPGQARDIVLDCCLYPHKRTVIVQTIVVMPEHVHMIMTPLTGEHGSSYHLENILKGIKGTSARLVNKLLERKGSLWLAESFDRMLRSDETAEAKGDYICMNPVRRGLVARPEEYRWLWRLSVNGRE